MADLPGFPNALSSASLMPLQANIMVPQSTALASGTGMLVTDTAIAEQMANFPDSIYDLRPTSHLMRLMQALLGDSGTGQLRKRLLVAQLSAQTTAGTAFFDLDRFYGAIFNASRDMVEQLPINPMDPATGVATPTEWESILSSDGAYRDRMNALAFGIAQGATQPGIVAAASAAIGAPVEVDESWAMIDAAGPGAGGIHTWGWVLGQYATWSALEGQLWGPLEGQTFYGRSGSLTRSELLVRIHKNYPQTPAGRQAQAVDEWALVRVLDQLIPAGLLMTVDTQAVTVSQPVEISAITSDSVHFEVVRQVTPVTTMSPTSPYPLSAGQLAAGLTLFDTRVLPVPPMSTRIGDSWTYAVGAQAASAVSWAPDPATAADFTQPGGVPDLSVPVDEQQITWSDGTTSTYSAALGLLDPAQALAARVGADGVLVAHPYSGDRRMVPTHT